MILSRRSETQHIPFSLSRDNTIFLKMSIFFLGKLAVFNKKTFNQSLFKQVGIYLSILFFTKVQPGVLGS